MSKMKRCENWLEEMGEDSMGIDRRREEFLSVLSKADLENLSKKAKYKKGNKQ